MKFRTKQIIGITTSLLMALSSGLALVFSKGKLETIQLIPHISFLIASISFLIFFIFNNNKK